MRKLITILFTVFYLLISLGLTVNIHYCQEKIQAVSLYTMENCCSDNNSIMSDCCHNEEVTLILDNKEQLTVHHNFPLNIGNFTTIEWTTFMIEASGFDNKPDFTFCDLPPPQKEASFILNCSFIFYG